MIKKTHTIAIDSSAGGNGDIWMRLVGFYTIAGLYPNLEITILIPSFFKKLAVATFGDRLIILDGAINKNRTMLVYTSLGLLSSLRGILLGKKYIAPYQRSIVYDKKDKEFKDTINLALFRIADTLGIIQLPEWKYIETYQAYQDVVAVKKLRHVSYEAFLKQLDSDYPSIFSKLNGPIPTSEELVIPRDLNENVLVFPTGTARQFMPLLWAKSYLPNAYFAFFFKDPEANLFRENGLKVINFYKEPGDIIKLSHNAKKTISTDSFPSHLLQYATTNCTITITEVLKSRIVSPAFKGNVVNSEVACHPCLHLDRTNNPFCEAGYTECLNWKNKSYIKNILDSIK